MKVIQVVMMEHFKILLLQKKLEKLKQLKQMKAIENEDEESDNSGEKEINKETIVQEVTNYSKLTKAQLKKLAQDKGFVGYNKLTKTGLVDLLNGNA